jgi:hypothetical protein
VLQPQRQTRNEARRVIVIALLCVSFVALAVGIGLFSEFLGDSVAPARDLGLAIGFGLSAGLCWALVYWLLARDHEKGRTIEGSGGRGLQTLIAMYPPVREGLLAVAFGVLSLALSLPVAHRRGIPGETGVESTLVLGLSIAVAATVVVGVILTLVFSARAKHVDRSPPPDVPVVRPSGIATGLGYFLSAALAVQLITSAAEDDFQAVFAIFGGMYLGLGASLLLWSALIKRWERRHVMRLLRGFPSGDFYAEEATAFAKRPGHEWSQPSPSEEARMAQELKPLNVDAPSLRLLFRRPTPRQWLRDANPAAGAPLLAIFLGLAAILLVVAGFATIPIWAIAVFLVLGGVGLLTAAKRR